MNFTDLIYKAETISSADGLLSADVFQHCFIRSSIHWQFGSTLYSWKYRKVKNLSADCDHNKEADMNLYWSPIKEYI
jgi:hypothetical protein